MATEVWKWQHETVSSISAAVMLTDGYPLVAGWEDADLEGQYFVAFKLDSSDGSILWKWQEGAKSDEIKGAAAAEDGSSVLVGHTYGEWAAENQGSSDFAAVKLDINGDVLWRLQDGSAEYDGLVSVVMASDGSAYMGGYSSDDFTILKVDSDGEISWTWKEGSDGFDRGEAVALVGDDDSVVLAGHTEGGWSGTSAGFFDFAAVKVNADGEEVWRWQDGTDSLDEIYSVVATDDGSVILSGRTFGLFDGANAGIDDLVSIKLDADGEELWRWQDGTDSFDKLAGSALGDDGYVVMGGFSRGDWSGTSLGSNDFLAVKLDAATGTTEEWRWQDGTSEDDYLEVVAAGSSGMMILGGETYGSYGATHTHGFYPAGVALMLQTGSSSALGSTSTTSGESLSESSGSQSPSPSLPPASTPSPASIPSPPPSSSFFPSPSLSPARTPSPTMALWPLSSPSPAPSPSPSPSMPPSPSLSQSPTATPTLLALLPDSSSTSSEASFIGVPTPSPFAPVFVATVAPTTPTSGQLSTGSQSSRSSSGSDPVVATVASILAVMALIVILYFMLGGRVDLSRYGSGGARGASSA